MNNFYTAITYEKSMQSSADKFYKHLIYNILFPNCPKEYINIQIKRWDFADPDGRKMQLDDIDVTLYVDINRPEFSEPSHYQWNISEKFRTIDYGDMFIELYSKYPHTKGWGCNTKADKIFYFTPNNVYIIKTEQLKDTVNDILSQFDLDVLMKSVSINDGIYKDTLITFNKIPTKINKKVMWNGVGTCISWDNLTKLGIKIEKHSYEL